MDRPYIICQSMLICQNVMDLHLVRQRDDMERQQIYFRGHTDAVTYLRKIKAI